MFAGMRRMPLSEHRGDTLFDHAEGRPAEADYFVELADVELRSAEALRQCAQPQPFDLAYLVGTGLPRRDAVAFDFAPHRSGGLASHGNEVVHGLFAAPPEIVNAGIDHKPRSAKQLHLQVTKPA